MSRYRLVVSGCDGSTRVEVPERLLAAALELAQMVTSASEYGCQPSAYVERTDHESAHAASYCTDEACPWCTTFDNPREEVVTP